MGTAYVHTPMHASQVRKYMRAFDMLCADALLCELMVNYDVNVGATRYPPRNKVNKDRMCREHHKQRTRNLKSIGFEKTKRLEANPCLSGDTIHRCVCSDF